MAVSKLIDPQTGETIYVEESLIPGSSDWGDQNTVEVDWEDVKKAQVVPIDEKGLNVSIVAQGQESPEEQVSAQTTGGGTGARGDNLGGALRNIAMSIIPGSAEIEAGVRSLFGDKSYEEYLQNARESREGYMIENPQKALALRIGGGIAGALLPFGAISKVPQLAKLGVVGRSALAGGTSGAAFGFGNAQGGFENRLSDALTGFGFGSVSGAASPLIPLGIGGTRNLASRLKRGWGEELKPQQVEEFILSNALSPTTESRRIASTLGLGASRGAQDIEDAAYDLLKLQTTMNTKNIPASYAGKTAGGTSSRDFLKATQVPSLTKAKEHFGEFVENVPTAENPIRPLSTIMKNNKTAEDILMANEDQFIRIVNGERVALDPGTFEYWQKAQQLLSNKLPKKYNPSKLSGEKKEIYDAIQDISKTREKLFPGTQKINQEYSDAIADQNFANKQINERLRVMSKQKEQLSLPGGAVPTAGWLLGPARQRGIARELIETGKLRPATTPQGYKSSEMATDAIIRSLLNMK